MDNWREINQLIPSKTRNDDGKHANTNTRPIKLSKENETICKAVCETIVQLLLSKQEFPKKHSIIIQGGYCSGKTAVLGSVENEILSSGHVESRHVWLISLNRYSTQESIFQFLAFKAKEIEMRDSYTLLSKSETKPDLKLKAAKNVLAHCRILLIDDLDSVSDGDVNFILEMAEENLISLATCTKQIKYEGENVHYFAIPDAEFSSENELVDYFQEVHSLQPRDTENTSLALANMLGPFFAAIVFRCINKNLLSAQELLSKMKNIENIENPRGKLIEHAVLSIIAELDAEDRNMLFSIASMRMPLPVKAIASMQNLLNYGLVQLKSAPKGQLYEMQNSVGFIVRKIMLENSHYVEEYTSGHHPTALVLWRYLLPLRLNSLLQDAEQHRWPFVPETWQYKDVVEAEESYNLKDVIHRINEYSDLEEIDILQECLYSSLVINDFDTAAALVFLMDRFTYWQGTVKGTIAVVDYIRKNSQETAIAPQLIIRKARLLKNEGDIQGAEKILNSLIQQEKNVGRWQYRKHDDYDLVSSVCVQIKGDILRGLGLWVDAARNLIKSIIGFRNLPKPDKKGWASSLSLLADAFQYMSLNDFQAHMVQQYELRGKHPLLEAISCVEEAARLSIYSPLFYSKNKRRGGELSSLYARLLPEESKERVNYLVYAATECIEGLRCHKSIASLESREQYYEFVFCVYKLSRVCEELRKFSVGYVAVVSKEISEILSDIALRLYDHYCSSEKRFQHTDWSILLIQTTLDLLKLPRIPRMEDNVLPKSTAASGKTNEEDLDTLKEHFKKANNDFTDDQLAVANEQSYAGAKLDEAKFICLEATVATEDYDDDDSNDGKESAPGDIRSAETQQTFDDDSQLANDAFESAIESGIRNSKTTCETAEENLLPNAAEASTIDDAVGVIDEDNSQYMYRLALTEDESSAGNAPVGLNKNEGDKESHIASGVRDLSTVELEGESSSSKGGANRESDRVIRDERTDTSDDGLMSKEIKKRIQETMVTLEESNVTEKKISDMKEILSVITHARKGRAYNAKIWRYDPQTRDWSTSETLAFVGDLLQLKEDKEGACRDAYMFEYITQEEPMSRYVGKQYKKLDKYKNRITVQQYKQDIICQMTSRYYVTQFNQQLYRKGMSFGQVQFLPSVLIELIDVSDVLERYFNVEPFMAGNFTKLTNNWSFVEKDDVQGKDLLLAFSHFSFCASDGKSIIVDIQGWTSEDKSGATFLTDPQIHTWDKKGFGTANRGKLGFQQFFQSQHAKCNEICRALKLARPRFLMESTKQ